MSLKVAIIPSLGNLELSALGDFDLVESNWCNDYFVYRRYYTGRSKSDGRYVILDNGAGIGAPDAVEHLNQTIHYMKPAEVVAPDHRQLGAETFVATSAFLTPLATRLYKNQALPYKLMVVPQGTDVREWEDYYDRTVALIKTLGLTGEVIIGVPKWLSWATDLPTDKYPTRMTILKRLNRPAEDIEHHLLGAGRLPLIEVAQAVDVPFIRGIDTSLPVHLAGEDRFLDEDTEITVPYTFAVKRPLNNVELARTNIQKLLSVAHMEPTQKSKPKASEMPLKPQHEDVQEEAVEEVAAKTPKVTVVKKTDEPKTPTK